MYLYNLAKFIILVLDVLLSNNPQEYCQLNILEFYKEIVVVIPLNFLKVIVLDVIPLLFYERYWGSTDKIEIQMLHVYTSLSW